MMEATGGFQPQGTDATLELWVAFSVQRSIGFVDTVICPSLVTSRSPSRKEKPSCDEALPRWFSGDHQGSEGHFSRLKKQAPLSKTINLQLLCHCEKWN